MAAGAGVSEGLCVGVSEGVCVDVCEGACDGVGSTLFVRSAHAARKAVAVNAIKRSASRRDKFFFMDYPNFPPYTGNMLA